MSTAHIDSNLIVKNGLVGVEKSMVAYFPFNNTVKDSVRGIMLITNVNTKIDSDGITIDTSLGDPHFILPSNLINFNEGTISFWFKPSSGFFTTTSWNRLIGHATNTNINEIQIKRNSTGNNLVMSMSNNAGQPQTSWSSCPSKNLIADTWYHVVAKWSISKGIMSLTVDGIKNEQALTTTYQPTIKGVLSLGYHPNTPRVSQSQFKNLSFYNKELSDNEVLQLYLNNNSFYNPTEEITFI